MCEADGSIVREGTIAEMKATMFASWIYDHLVGSGGQVKVAHSAMLQAIVASKRKNDTVDAQKIAGLPPECHFHLGFSGWNCGEFNHSRVT